MSMQELEILSPAKKAWATRRARMAESAGDVTMIRPTAPSKQSAKAKALAAFEAAAASSMPDWHGAALALKAALTAKPAPKITVAKAAALPAPDWHDYDVNKFGSFHVRSDMLVVTFADGEIVRAPAVSGKGRPTNIGRGLRLAIAFWQARAAWRRKVQYRDGPRFPVPEIVSCVCEDTGRTYDAGECTRRTVDARRGRLVIPTTCNACRAYLLRQEFEGGKS